MAIIWAQLIVDGKSQGPHPFVVPIRCKKTHRLLPGVTIGDCGLKNGLNYIDNGYIILENVRIPSYNLLGKIGGIDESGAYNTLIENSDMRFGFHMSPLSGGRGLLSLTANGTALKAVTFALRYACNRKQFDNAKKTDEVLIIDYALTKNRLLPSLAQIIVQIPAGGELSKAYFGDPNIFTDLKYIGELHAISAAVKARVSWTTTSISQETRSVLGGHGYSALGKFASYFHDIDVNITWEGDNYMLLQQTSKYVMKTIAKKAKTKILDLSFAWQALTIDEEKLQTNLRSIDTLGTLLKGLLVAKYRNAEQTFEDIAKHSKDESEVWLHFHPQAGNSLALTYGTSATT
jgi:acyl-CoA oxidase